jgi:hypothetical protein
VNEDKFGAESSRHRRSDVDRFERRIGEIRSANDRSLIGLVFQIVFKVFD